MEPTTDDCLDLALAILYRRRSAVEGMIQRLQRENDPSIERVLAHVYERFEHAKGFIRSNLVSPN